MPFSYTILTNEAKEWIIAFYGYGQKADVFKPLAEKTNSRYNILVIDLPYNEQAISISKEVFVQEIAAIFQSLQISKIIGISYSMGSRFNLLLAQCFPQTITKLILIAPDGIQISWFNRIATNTMLGKIIFKYLTFHQHIFLRILAFLFSLKLICQSMYAFAKWHMRDVSNRKKVYYTWMNMREMIPNLHIIAQHKLQYAFNILAYFGKHDEVIKSNTIKRFKQHFPSAQIIVLPKGHQILDKDFWDELSQVI